MHLEREQAAAQIQHLRFASTRRSQHTSKLALPRSIKTNSFLASSPKETSCECRHLLVYPQRGSTRYTFLVPVYRLLHRHGTEL